jgi:hypothetical protein
MLEEKKIVISMVESVPEADIPRLLSEKLPHPIEFFNHQSLYTHWDFSSEQIQNLVRVGAAKCLNRTRRTDRHPTYGCS